ncbi:hypothetical protein V8G54_023741 [Vigna mungo]|uniref:non-specific serine/threonine protein kinase n=1 Tax=Vigna mungo TaxID=3915 RepID=A0AAQ3N5T7_VIGMU
MYVGQALMKIKLHLAIDLQENKLTGQIPDEIGNCTALIHLNLKSNQLTGPTPSTLTQIPNLKTLDLARNRLIGDIPRLLYGNEVLQYLDVRGNNLTGTIPDSIGNCTNFEVLSLQGNRLTGKIPEVIGLMQALVILDLSENELIGPIPPILGNLSFIGKLYLNGNMITGPIPPELGNMSRLNYLQLNDNKLLYFYFVFWNLSHNSLQGPLPAEFGNFKSIQTIDISFNHLLGSIPPEIGQLQNLVSLILNNNDLHGKIPDQLTNCLSLNFLNVSYNNLSGVIPLMKNFSQFSADSFIGNPLLCGNWSGSICDPYIRKSRVVFSRAAVLCLIVGTILFLAMVTVALYISSQFKELIKGSRGTEQEPSTLVILHMGLANHTLDDIMRVTENLSENYIVGYGASGTVYKCALQNFRPIAIKRLHNQHQHNSSEFETELETIGSIRHRNLVTLYGYALTPNGNLLFYDYMENGSLWGPLETVKLDWKARLRIAVGASEGLAYLHHDCNPRIIHRDIKSSNILIHENFEARLSDFGFSKCLSTARTHTYSDNLIFIYNVKFFMFYFLSSYIIVPNPLVAPPDSPAWTPPVALGFAAPVVAPPTDSPAWASPVALGLDALVAVPLTDYLV